MDREPRCVVGADEDSVVEEPLDELGAGRWAIADLVDTVGAGFGALATPGMRNA
jgi:hypothetical protein